LRRVTRWTADDHRTFIAFVLAHELAHLSLGHSGSAILREIREAEADELGTFYYHRAGLNCWKWVELFARWYQVEAVDRQRNVSVACASAERGERPARRPDVARHKSASGHTAEPRLSSSAPERVCGTASVARQTGGQTLGHCRLLDFDAGVARR